MDATLGSHVAVARRFQKGKSGFWPADGEITESSAGSVSKRYQMILQKPDTASRYVVGVHLKTREMQAFGMRQNRINNK